MPPFHILVIFCSGFTKALLMERHAWNWESRNISFHHKLGYYFYISQSNLCKNTPCFKKPFHILGSPCYSLTQIEGTSLPLFVPSSSIQEFILMPVCKPHLPHKTSPSEGETLIAILRYIQFDGYFWVYFPQKYANTKYWSQNLKRHHIVVMRSNS